MPLNLSFCALKWFSKLDDCFNPKILSKLSLTKQIKRLESNLHEKNLIQFMKKMLFTYQKRLKYRQDFKKNRVYLRLTKSICTKQPKAVTIWWAKMFHTLWISFVDITYFWDNRQRTEMVPEIMLKIVPPAYSIRLRVVGWYLAI